jgi:hypothetical protein
VAELIDEFIKLLAHHEGAVPDASDVRESALAAAVEIRQPSPRWRHVRMLLKAMKASVAGVSTLATALANIQTIVDHFPR